MSDIFGGPPDDEGFDIFGYPLDYGEVENPWGFEIDETWFDNITLGEVTMSSGEWHNYTMQPYDTAELEYGMDMYEIIMDLQAMGYWDDDDWETWRNQYELQGG